MSLATALLALFGSVVFLQTPAAAQTRKAPDFKVEVWGFVVADFSARMSAYAELRTELQKGLPALTVTSSPVEIAIAEDALARRIREVRERARQGEIFTPSISAAFREVLIGETNAGTCAAILEDNPGDFSHRITGPYPKDEPLSTMPPGMLRLLPALPADVQYRFLSRNLILHDTRANVILDRIDDAIRCPR